MNARPGPRPRSSWWPLPCLLAAGCSGEPATLQLIPEDLGLEVLFGLELDAAGQVLGTSSPLFLEGEARMRAQSFRTPSTHEAWLVGYRAETLMRVSRLYDARRRAELELGSPDRPECAEGHRSSDGTRFTGAAPAPNAAWRTRDGQLRPVDPSEASFILEGRRTLTVPIDERACIEPTHRELRPYGEVEVPIPVGLLVDGVPLTRSGVLHNRVLRLPDEQILLMTPEWLFLLERGKAFSPQPGRYLALVGGSAGLATNAYGPREPGAPIRIVIANYGDDPNAAGAWQEIELDPSGLVSREIIELSEQAQDVLYDPNTGWFIGAGARGSIIVRRDQSAELEWFPNKFVASDSRALLAHTGWPERPYVVTGSERGQIARGSPDLETWELLPIDGLDSAARFRAVISVPSPDGPRLYVADHAAGLHWFDRAKARWVEEPLVLPSSFDCGSPTNCGGRVQTYAIRDLRYATRGGVGHLYATMNDCMAILDIRLDGPCPDYLPMPGRSDLRPPQTTLPGGLFFLNVRAIDVSPSGWLTVASQEGGVYELRVAPAAPEGG